MSLCVSRHALVFALSFALSIYGIPWRAHAQQAAAPQATSQDLSKERIEQLVAPIALYPDPLLSQVLMASTYPLEVVQAARWQSANSKLTGKGLDDALQKEPWDASVKSLTAFPSVLKMMNDKLDWTQQLGDAFLAQQGDVMAAIQSLRQRADAQGSLKTTKQQKVSKSTSGSQTFITIEPQDESVVYVPAYDPMVVYGDWPYPDYPPYYYYPPGYIAGPALWFGAGIAAGGALWGICNWARRDVNIDVNRYNKFNHTNISSANWQHQVDHRKGVPYADKRVADQYRKGAQNAASREQFRGHAEAGRKDLAKPEVRQAARDAAQPKATQPKAKPSQKGSQAKAQPKSGGGTKAKQAQRPSGGNASAFDRSGPSSKVRTDSARGQASRAASQGSFNRAPVARGGGGGGGRVGGGGGRGGGGGGGGRGRR